MLLKIDGLDNDPLLMMHEVCSKPREGKTWSEPRPKHLNPLGDVLWPQDVKNKIHDIFKAIGVADPWRQKLVEPYAIVFGGRDNDGSYDLADVDWEMVVDYFRWEASAWTRLR